MRSVLVRRWDTLQADALVTVDAAMAAMAEGIVPIAPITALLEHD